MSITVSQLCKNFESGVDKVRKLSKDFCAPLEITTFGYVRIYDDGRTSWLTSNPDQDRYLIESGALKKDPLADTKEALKEGCYLYFNDRQFSGSEQFYRERAERFQMDHGMVVVKHQKDYLETCCFSGLFSKRPLYQLFMNEQPLFHAFMEHFTEHLDRRLLNFLEQGVAISDLKEEFGQPNNKHLKVVSDRSSLIAACGWKKLLLLSRRERECLALLRKGHSCAMIASLLELSQRTVEHYIESVKNKLGLESRAELFLAADKLSLLQQNI